MFLLSSDYWEIKHTKGKGRGVLAKKDIEAGTVIGDYIGTFIRADEEEKYEKKYGFYTIYYHERASLFPDIKKPGIHLINHSCAPNCYMYSYQGHTLYFALRKIFAGEEFSVSYLVSPLDDNCSPCTHFCTCGSEMCTNLFHATPKEYDRWTTFDEKMTEGVKLPRVTYGEELALLPRYPTNIPDNHVYPLYGSTQANPLTMTDVKLPEKKILRDSIRNSGRQLQFSTIGLTVQGISDTILFSKHN